MLSFLQNYMVEREKRAIPKYHTYLKQQNNHIYKYYKRFFLQHGTMSPAVHMLRYLLQFPDYEYLDSQLNNFDRYLYHLRGLYPSLISTFDRVQREGSYRKRFYLSENTEEFILPVADVNTPISLPLGSNRWQDWCRVRPVRLWYNDSPEYSVNMLHDAVKYHDIAPSVAITMIDVHALILKYYTWRHTVMLSEPNLAVVLEDPKTYFIHKYVMCQCVWDLANAWLMNIANDLVSIQDINSLHIYLRDLHSIGEIQYGYMPDDYLVGFEALWKVFHESAKSNLRPEAVLSTKFFFNGSLIDRYNLSLGRLDMCHLRKYNYLEFIRDQALFTLIVNIFKQRPALPTTRSLLNVVGRRYARYLLGKPWNSCNRTELRERVKRSMEEVAVLLEL